MTLQEMLQEIRFFGAKPTLDSIEKVKAPRLRRQLRKLFEEAFHILREGTEDKIKDICCLPTMHGLRDYHLRLFYRTYLRLSY